MHFIEGRPLLAPQHEPTRGCLKPNRVPLSSGSVLDLNIERFGASSTCPKMEPAPLVPYGSERKSGALNDPDREGVNRFEQDAALLYCSYLQDLASVARVCAFRFLSTFEQLRDKERVAEPLRAREHRPIGFPRRSGRRFPGSKHFMQY